MGPGCWADSMQNKKEEISLSLEENSTAFIGLEMGRNTVSLFLFLLHLASPEFS